MNRWLLAPALAVLPYLTCGASEAASPVAMETWDSTVPTLALLEPAPWQGDGRLTSIGQSQAEQSDSETFRAFKQDFDKLNRRVEEAVGCVFFTDAEELGTDTVQVTATRSWLGTPLRHQRSNLQKILEIWRAAYPSDRALTVKVVDRQGEERMTMSLNSN